MEDFQAAILLWFQQNPLGRIFWFVFCEALSSASKQAPLEGVGGSKMHARVTMGTDEPS